MQTIIQAITVFSNLFSMVFEFVKHKGSLTRSPSNITLIKRSFDQYYVSHFLTSEIHVFLMKAKCKHHFLV